MLKKTLDAKMQKASDVKHLKTVGEKIWEGDQR